ncbi:MAG: CvpA family protein [Lamprocystis purpurea]|jgi:membrane protein required for colicin V production|uniref:CvpA family protein n=1 Tax=Lamprocystis purpurea TaxID=61598 RepID=UPI000378750B|nr:CvpA family protein [Lamprocystis purpurea]MBV5276145.1 CvpA family protein [Lamprocystis purpurea]
MNWVDIAIVAIILVSALIGLARGLIREVLSLAVWVAALGVAYLYHKGVADALTAQIAQPNVRAGVAFVGLVLIVLILGSIIGALLTALIDKTGLTGLDRLLGLIFGAGRGGVVVAMAVFLAALTPLPEESWWQESAVIVQFQQAADWLLGLVPSDIQEQLKRV